MHPSLAVKTRFKRPDFVLSWAGCCRIHRDAGGHPLSLLFHSQRPQGRIKKHRTAWGGNQNIF